MKKRIGLLMAAVLAIGMLAGCGAFKSDENALYIKKNGTITQAVVEEFSQDYYDESELKDYVSETIDTFTANHADSTIDMSGFSVKDGIAKMNLKYSDYTTYTQFNGKELFVGTVAQAVAAGYDFNQNFVTITNGASADANASGNASADAASSDATADLTAYVVIMQESQAVKVEGSIKYVSANATKVTAKDTVSVNKDEDSDELTYIIFE